MYIGLQGMSFVLRDGPGGYINFAVMDTIGWKLGPMPVAFVVLVVVALLAEYVLRTAALGWQLRAVGSARGIRPSDGHSCQSRHHRRLHRVSLFTALGAVMLMAQIGVGDPAAGRELHAGQHHGGRSGRHQPARRARHLRRHA